ncbi:MAG: hypothetical protein PUB59_05000 [Firmicutes bacterium]|nr:hypothetical protein [Bacillota bacterium]
MKTDKKRYLAALLLLMLTVLMATGVAYGHYEAKIQKELNFNVQMQNAAYLFQGGEGVADFVPLDEATNGWTSTEPDTAILNFRLSNVPSATAAAPAENMYVVLRILVTEGAGNGLNMVLKVGENEYRATAEAIPEGSTLYQTFGAGWIYRFYGNSAQTAQVELTLAGGERSMLDGTLTVSGKTAYDSLMRLEITTI